MLGFIMPIGMRTEREVCGGPWEISSSGEERGQNLERGLKDKLLDFFLKSFFLAPTYGLEPSSWNETRFF